MNSNLKFFFLIILIALVVNFSFLSEINEEKKPDSQASKELNIHIIHISTDFIFDGKKGYYLETDTPNPLSYY